VLVASAGAWPVSCIAEDRRTAHQLEAALAVAPRVEAVDVLAPGSGPRPGWTIEIVATGAVAGPHILRPLARYGASIADVSPHGEHVVATVAL